MTLRKNLRGEMGMDVDEDEDGTQRPKQVEDYGIEVDFSSLENDDREVGQDLLSPVALSKLTSPLQDGSAEAGAEFDVSIAKLTNEIERMAPNMKAMERFVWIVSISYLISIISP